MFFEIMVTFPGKIVGSVAHPEHRVEKKLKRSLEIMVERGLDFLYSLSAK